MKLWSVGALQSITRWLELLALGVYVFDLTRSPLMVTMVTLLKFAPLALFGIPFGALSASFAPRSVYLVGIVSMVVVNLVGLYLALHGTLGVLQALVISFAGGLFWVLDFPVRRALIGDSVEQSRLGQAMAIDTIANNGTRMLGPLAGGVLLQYVGLSGAFVLATVIYALCLLLTVRLQIGRVVLRDADHRSVIASLGQGLRLIQDNPLLMAVLMVTVVYNLFGFPLLSLVPVIGRDTLQLSPGTVGLLASMEGAGALIGSAIMMRFASTVHFRRLYVSGLLIFFTASGVYAWLQQAVPIGVMLMIAGSGSAAFAAMQTTLLILNSPREYRSRVFGLLSLSIGTGLLGFTFVGVLANYFGAQSAIFTGALCGLISTALICRRWPMLMAGQQ